MSYGLQVSNAQGQVVYDTTSVTWLTIESFITQRDTSYTRNYYGLTGFSEMRAHIQLLNTPPTDQEGYAPIVTVPAFGTVQVSLQGTKAEQAIITVLVR